MVVGSLNFKWLSHTEYLSTCVGTHTVADAITIIETNTVPLMVLYTSDIRGGIRLLFLFFVVWGMKLYYFA